MVKQTHEALKIEKPNVTLAQGVRVLVIEAPYYPDIAHLLLSKTKDMLHKNNCNHETISVEGALEIPQALEAAAKANLFGPDETCFKGAIALGCIVRGQTSHYEIVCQNTNFWLMKIALRHGIFLGNGILTVDTLEQARERAHGINSSSKGEDAVRACLGLIELKRKFSLISQRILNNANKY